MHTLSTHPADPWVPDPPAVRDTGTGFDPATAPGPDRGTLATSTADLEGRLTAILATVTGRQVGPEDDFFTDLGADSMLMARFCARVRKQPDLPTPSIKDVYRNRTITSLARALGDPEPDSARTASPLLAAFPSGQATRTVATWEYLLCGLLQAVTFMGYLAATSALLWYGYQWASGGAGLTSVYLRTVALTAGSFLVASAVPVAAKWALVGRWTAQRFPVWSLRYFRFWLVKTLIRTSPLMLFVGSPLLVWYLRALGARVGPGVLLLTRTVPVATDLFTLGSDSVIRKDAVLTGYRVVAGMVEVGPLTLGRGVVVGEGSVLDVGTVMGDGSQLGHRSSLQTGQVIPDGQRWHGSPARLTDVDYLRVPPRPVSRARRFWYPLTQVAVRIGVVAPAGAAALLLAATVPGIADLQSPAHRLDDPAMYLQTAGLTAGLLVGGMLLTFLVATSVPRMLAVLIAPGRTYPVYGLHYAVHRWITRLSTVPSLLALVGDSSYVVGYLQALGYQLAPVRQTGSNFGSAVRHETPFHARVGSGTMVADGLSLANAEYSSSSFRVDPATVGADNFLGNHIIYPAEGRTGDNCLLATKVMVPIDGPVRTGVGLLGSPSFEIPRTVDRDTELDNRVPAGEHGRRLAAKNRHNLVSMLLLLTVRWAAAYLATLTLIAGAELAHLVGPASLAAGMATSLVATLALTVTAERAALGFRPLRPQSCSIYDPRFWAHERYWKVVVPVRAEALLNGTPFKAWYWRALGTRVGRRLFDDGVGIPERTLVSIGSDVTLNVGSVIQCHSQEDGGFKSDRTEVGSGATVGTSSLIHYGVSVGAGAILATDSFLMKGESVPPGSLWGGNPARQVRPAHGSAAAAAGALSIQ